MMKQTFLAPTMALVCGLTIGGTTAKAATFNVDGADYDLTTFVGTYADNQEILQEQVWWADLDLAQSIATVVGDSLLLPNVAGLWGPMFASRERFSLSPLVESSYFNSLGGGIGTASFGVGAQYTYVIATPLAAVPLPAGVLLLLTSLAGVSALRRRKTDTL